MTAGSAFPDKISIRGDGNIFQSNGAMDGILLTYNGYRLSSLGKDGGDCRITRIVFSGVTRGAYRLYEYYTHISLESDLKISVNSHIRSYFCYYELSLLLLDCFDFPELLTCTFTDPGSEENVRTPSSSL